MLTFSLDISPSGYLCDCRHKHKHTYMQLSIYNKTFETKIEDGSLSRVGGQLDRIGH